MGIPVSAAGCCHNPVEVFGELTAIIGEGFFDPSAEYILHGGKEPGGTGRSSGRFDTDQCDAGKQVNADVPMQPLSHTTPSRLRIHLRQFYQQQAAAAGVGKSKTTMRLSCPFHSF